MANILLTGASRGIGAAAHAVLSAAGHRVIGHSTAGGDAGNGALLAADLASPRAADALWDAAIAALGRIDVLINNAGVFEAAAIADAEAFAAAWIRCHAINLHSAADLCRHAVLHFQRTGGGRIINIASRAGHRGDSPDHWHYAAAKAGMLALTKTIARGYAHQGILAFAVAPGFTLTGMADDYLATGPNDIPLGRVASTGEIAETIRWLAAEAPASLTGATLDINGASHVR